MTFEFFSKRRPKNDGLRTRIETRQNAFGIKGVLKAVADSVFVADVQQRIDEQTRKRLERKMSETLDQPLHHACKMSARAVIAMRAAYWRYEWPSSRISEYFGVNYATARRVIDGVSYSSVGIRESLAGYKNVPEPTGERWVEPIERRADPQN